MIIVLFALVTIVQPQDPTVAVRGYLEGMKAMNAAQMQQYLADDYTLVSTDGNERLYNRELTAPICAWERGMNTRWSYKIVGVDKNSVSVILQERNDYFTLLGLGRRTQVAVYLVEAGKIRRSFSKLVV